MSGALYSSETSKTSKRFEEMALARKFIRRKRRRRKRQRGMTLTRLTMLAPMEFKIVASSSPS